MSFLLANLPPVHCFVRKEFLYDFKEDHKSYNFIELDNGQYAAQPNNRCLFFDAASNPKEMKFPDFKVATRKFVVEHNPKWSLGDTDTVMYE